VCGRPIKVWRWLVGLAAMGLAIAWSHGTFRALLHPFSCRSLPAIQGAGCNQMRPNVANTHSHAAE